MEQPLSDLEASDLTLTSVTRRPSFRRTLGHHLSGLLAEGRKHSAKLYFFIRTLLSPPPEFEKAFASSALKFQLGYILMQVVGAASLEIYFNQKEYPDAGLLVPLAINVGVRLLVLCCCRFCRRLPLLQVATLLTILDALLIASWTPNGIWSHWSLHVPHKDQKLPRMTSLPPLGLRDQQMSPMTSLPPPGTGGLPLATNGQAAGGYQSVAVVGTIYAYQFSIWYSVMFLLTFRFALVGMTCYLLVGTLVPVMLKTTGAMDDFVGACEAITILLVICVKVQLELLQRTHLKNLEEKTKEALNEKVLRFQAEFAQEQTQSELRAPEGFSESELQLQQTCPAAGWACKSRPQAPSLRSAPPALLSFVRGAELRLQEHREEECLAPDSLVWVEGSVLPTKVQEVQPDQRVLCYDNISGYLKYAQVSGVQTITGDAEWVSVALADGTALTMTADHPVQHHAAAGLNSRSYQGLKRAGDLKPGQDAVTILRMVPMPVLRVSPFLPPASGVSSQRSRVALSERQPDRHSVFVAASGDGMAGKMAVGSANANYTPSSHLACGPMKERWTFLTFEDLEERPGRRAHSAPPSLRPPGSEAEEAPSGTLKRSSSLSDLSSERSSQNSQEHAVLVWTRDQQNDQRFQIPDTNSVALSEMLGAKLRGLKSVGSELHSANLCKPCVFESKRLHFGLTPCFRGALCERCHEVHNPEDIKRTRKSGATRRAEKREAARSVNGLPRVPGESSPSEHAGDGGPSSQRLWRERPSIFDAE